MARVELTEWWRRRLGRWIDLARKDARRPRWHRPPPPSTRTTVRARYHQLKAKQRDLLSLDYRRDRHP
jgi:hypothetical protein